MAAPRPRGGKHIRLARELARQEYNGLLCPETHGEVKYIEWSKRVHSAAWREAQMQCHAEQDDTTA